MSFAMIQSLMTQREIGGISTAGGGCGPRPRSRQQRPRSQQLRPVSQQSGRARRRSNSRGLHPRDVGWGEMVTRTGQPIVQRQPSAGTAAMIGAGYGSMTRSLPSLHRDRDPSTSKVLADQRADAARRQQLKDRRQQKYWNQPLQDRHEEMLGDRAADNERWERTAGRNSPHRQKANQFKAEQLGHEGKLSTLNQMYQEEATWIQGRRAAQDPGDETRVWANIEARQAVQQQHIEAYAEQMATCAPDEPRAEADSRPVSRDGAANRRSMPRGAPYAMAEAHSGQDAMGFHHSLEDWAASSAAAASSSSSSSSSSARPRTSPYLLLLNMRETHEQNHKDMSAVYLHLPTALKHTNWPE